MTNSAKRSLILASGSSRRADLLRQYGYEFTIVVPPGDEPGHLYAHLPPADQARALSQHKARSVRRMIDAGVILAADTVVALGERVFGKPADRNDARAIIRTLSGTTHQVITAVTLMDAAPASESTEHATTAVAMRDMSDAEIESYLDTGDWAGKAGAYGIQDRGDQFVTALDGSFTNVVGLPMELTAALLDLFDIPRP